MEIFIIPLIALAVYILQYIFKGPDDNKQQPGQRRPGGPAQRTNPGKPRRQVSDLDRFLEETRKRKQQEEGRPTTTTEPTAGQSLSDTADRDRERERERKTAAARASQNPPKPTQRRERKQGRPQAPPPPPPQPARRPLRETAAPVLLEVAPNEAPVLTPVPPPVVVVEPTSAQMPTSPSAPPPLPTPRTGLASVAGQRRVTTPVVNDLVQMLRKPKGIALAFILREILDPPPSCRRD